jgi:hypothetical protein
MRRSVVAVNPPLAARGRADPHQFRLARTIEETKMRLLGKTAIVLGMAGAMALGSMTASEARNGRNAAIAAGAGGFVAGAAIGAAAANANAGYYGGYDSYAYEPAYVAPAPVYTSPSYYGPVTGYDSYSYNSGYDTNYIGPWRERKLMGLD